MLNVICIQYTPRYPYERTDEQKHPAIRKHQQDKRYLRSNDL